jgi:hypothetical protein
MNKTLLMYYFDQFFVSKKENKREELRMKTGRSKRCLLCQNHRCIIASCQCECHKDYSGRSVPRVSRQMPTKRDTKLKELKN